MPLIRNFPFQNLRMRSANAQSMAGFIFVNPFILIPAYIGSVEGSRGSPTWHVEQTVRSFGRVRRYVSLLRPVVLSTVSAITVHPAASTRRSSCSQASHVLGA